MKYKCIGGILDGEEVGPGSKQNSFYSTGFRKELYILQTFSTSTEHFDVYVHHTMSINEAIAYMLASHKPETLPQAINNDAHAQLNKAKEVLHMVTMMKRVGGVLPGVKEMIDNVVREAEEVLGQQESTVCKHGVDIICFTCIHCINGE